MKKAICLLIALSLLLSLGACAANKPSSRPQEVVSGGGAIHFSSSEADREPAVPENPPAVPEEEGPSYAPIPSSSTPSYASSSISYPSSSSSSSSSAALPPSSSSSVAPAPSSTSSSSRPPVSPSSSASSVPEDPASQEDEEELSLIHISEPTRPY